MLTGLRCVPNYHHVSKCLFSWSLFLEFFSSTCFILHPKQENLVKQGVKSDHATSLVEVVSSKCSAVKYDVEIAEEYIARQVMARSFKMKILFHYLRSTQYWKAAYLCSFFLPDLIILLCGSQQHRTSSPDSFPANHLHTGCCDLQSAGLP